MYPCIDIVDGCMYSEAMNYNPSATVDTDPTSCVLKVEGLVVLQMMVIN